MRINYLLIRIFLLINLLIINELSAQNWALVMSEKTGFTHQIWRTRNHFPDKEIEEFWNQGYSITSLSHHEGWWALVMSAGTGYGLQVWKTDVTFPAKYIDEYWAKGYHITHLTYGDGKWALVMTKGSGYGKQSWFTRETFPEKEINDWWAKGYYIISMDYGNNLWAVVMSEGTGFTNQTWQRRIEYPEKEIEEYWEKGYKITNLTYGKAAGQNVWAVVISEGTKYGEQTWQTRDVFPAKEIQEYWDQGYDITGIYHGVEETTNPTEITYKKPEVNWNSPNIANTKVIKPEYTVKACIKSETPLSKINLYINNVLQPDSRGYEVVPDVGCDNTISRKIQLKKGANQIKLEVENKGGTTIAEIRTITYEELRKPEISWNTPSTLTAKSSKAEYTIKACVKSESAVSKVNVYINNVLQQEGRGFEIVSDEVESCTNTISRKLQLQKGANQIKLEVQNSSGTTTSEVRTINYDEANPTNVETPTQVTTTKTTTKEKRLALIFGNSKYEKSALKNPVNDARAMEKSLKNLGFDIIKYEDVNQANMKKAIDEYGQKLKAGKYDVALFFYAGHGLQVKGNNYLIPIGCNISEEQDVEYECVDAGRVLAKMEGAGSRINIVIMDACRDNPFERSWSRSTKGNGLATMDAPVGSIVCYSTSPGKTAADGEGNNGLYTEELLKHLNTPGLALEEVFKRVRIGVITKSNRQQTPWETSSLTGDFFFAK